MATTAELAQKAQTLRALHRPGTLLLLVNAWDAASARLVEKAGSPAVATTSAGIAFACGYPDGERIPRERMLEAVRVIARAVAVPVTADVEAGYGDSAEAIRRTAAGVLEAGAVGINLEDGTDDSAAPLADVERQVEKIRGATAESKRLGVRLVVNARTDVYLRQVGPESGRLEETVRRGLAYRDAGADCVFVPGVTDPDLVAVLVRRLACPVNILAAPGMQPFSVYAGLGVARISFGSGPMRAAVSLVARMAEDALTKGTLTGLDGILSHAALNALLAERAPR